jgi:hypothetical protein
MLMTACLVSGLTPGNFSLNAALPVETFCFSSTRFAIEKLSALSQIFIQMSEI